ncbi:hypothetical protein V1477_004278 [Vespula maculifrons]|uniref:Uncharacterized protein n=1 Tax=Vespula maculifrons TaxID=7453 RepID=A0ABD2CRH7_VESMC
MENVRLWKSQQLGGFRRILFHLQSIVRTIRYFSLHSFHPPPLPPLSSPPPSPPSPPPSPPPPPPPPPLLPRPTSSPPPLLPQSVPSVPRYIPLGKDLLEISPLEDGDCIIC